MSVIVALGERARVEGFALAGVEVIGLDDPKDVRHAWEQLTDEVAVLLLTPAARAHLSDEIASRPDLVWTVIPD